MHVGHYRYLLNIRRAPEAFDRLRHVVVHRPRKPRSNGRECDSVIAPSTKAGTKHHSGARFRVIAIATSERRRGASRWSAAMESATGRPSGITTCTRSRPQSGAGETCLRTDR